MGGSSFWSISVYSDDWLSSSFRKRNERCWITEPPPAYSLGTAYRLSRTLYLIHYGGCFTHPEMWYSGKGCGTQHQMLQMKQSWTSTFTEMSSRNPDPHRSYQPNVKWRSYWTMIYIRSLHSQRRSHENWLALRRHLEMHGSCRPQVVAEPPLGRIRWQSLHNSLSNMMNSKIWFTSTLQLWSPTIMRMGSIQSHIMQPPSLRLLRNGIRRWKQS